MVAARDARSSAEAGLSGAAARVESANDLAQLLSGIIDTAIALTEADFGNIQLLDADGRLISVAQRGFTEDWIDYWNTAANEFGACGAALAQEERVIVEDVERSPLFAGSPALEVQRRAGVRALQCTPLHTRCGKPVGMLSTHYRRPCRPDARALQVLDLLAAHAASVVENSRAEQTLKDLEAHYLAVLETSTDGFLMLDESGRVLAANARYARRSGYTLEELLTLHITDLEAQESPEQARQHQALIRQQGGDLFQTVHRTKSGERWHAEVNVVYRPEAGGRYFAFQRDISERMRLEAQLRLSEERLRLAMEATDGGLWDWDIETGSVYFSPRYATMLGYVTEEIPPHYHAWVGLVHPDEADAVSAEVQRLMTNQGHWSIEFRMRHKDGRYVWIMGRGKVVEHDAEGRPRRAIGTHTDITERKHLEEEIRTHNEVMQSLTRHQVAMQTAAAFAHELNQPLLAITAYNEVALHTLAGNPVHIEQLTHVIQASYEQALRAGQVLNALNAHLHRDQPEPAGFDLNQLVREILVRRRAWPHKFRSRLALDPQLPKVLGHRLQTEKVLINLIQNGLEAMEEAQLPAAAFEIAVETRTRGNLAHVTLRDGGPGLDAKAARAIFEPFFTTKAHGLGLGLSICRALIEAQHGQFWFDPEGRPGAVFHFTLPLGHD